jgi:hypothetical protein
LRCFSVSCRSRPKRERSISPPARIDPAERANRQWKRAAVAVATGDLGPGDALQKQGLAMGKVELTTLRRHTTNLKKTFKAWADAWAEKPETRIASPTIGSPTGCAQSPVWFSPASPSTPATDSSVTDGPGALTSPMFPTSMKVSNFYERRL